jgi:hypothetical protein
MSHLQPAMIRSLQGFATELTRAPLYDCGHADAWELVERAGTTEDLLLALGYPRVMRDGQVDAGA